MDYDVFYILEMNKEPEEFDDLGRPLPKPFDILPESNLMSFKVLCDSMSNMMPSEYFILQEKWVYEVYELYAIRTAAAYCQEQKYKKK